MHTLIELKSKKQYTVQYNCTTHKMSIHTPYSKWEQDYNIESNFRLEVEQKNYTLSLIDALDIQIEYVKNGLGEGVKVTYSGWKINEGLLKLKLQTYIWVDQAAGDLHLEIIPLEETGEIISHIMWPVPFKFDKGKETAYTVLPMMQGCIIPSNWPKPISVLYPQYFYERAAYMPWWGQIDEGTGYIAIVETPWDCGYDVVHDMQSRTTVQMRWDASLGKLSYRRKLRYTFIEQGDYNTLCKIYRQYIKEKGKLITLAQKCLHNPNLEQLVGSAIVHECAYTHIEPKSAYYNHNNLEENDRFTSFETIGEALKALKQAGLEKAYLHLDGWGKRGYDNLHPDVFPPSEVCGGWEGLRRLGEICETLGYLFGIHDQYRDYYRDSETYTLEHALKKIDGSHPIEDIWYGGEHTWLCAQMAPYYVKRNYTQLLEEQIGLKGTYLDVFSVVGLDECFHEEHPMTRKECMERRIECLEYVKAQGLIVSSEELVDWAIPTLELCHHAPYALTPSLDGGEAIGIPVPLLNLVYHECIVIPWGNTKGGWGIPEGNHGHLHALLNGGTTYANLQPTPQQIQAYNLITKVYKQVAFAEMEKHEFVEGRSHIQRTYFDNGIIVTVNFEDDTYYIQTPEGILKGSV